MEHSLIELERTVWELDWRELRQEAVVQAAKSLVLLIDGPWLTIEFDFDHILSVRPMVHLVLHHPSICYLHLKRDLEEYCALSCVVFCALLDMIYKCFPRVKDVAKFALHGDGVLEHSLVYLNWVYFLSQLSIAFLNVLDRFWQILICAHELLTLFRLLLITLILASYLSLLQACLSAGLLSLLLYGLHKLTFHWKNTLLLLLLTFKHFVSHLFFFLYVGFPVDFS